MCSVISPFEVPPSVGLAPARPPFRVGQTLVADSAACPSPMAAGGWGLEQTPLHAQLGLTWPRPRPDPSPPAHRQVALPFTGPSPTRAGGAPASAVKVAGRRSRVRGAPGRHAPCQAGRVFTLLPAPEVGGRLQFGFEPQKSQGRENSLTRSCSWDQSPGGDQGGTRGAAASGPRARPAVSTPPACSEQNVFKSIRVQGVLIHISAKVKFWGRLHCSFGIACFLSVTVVDFLPLKFQRGELGAFGFLILHSFVPRVPRRCFVFFFCRF